jgi:hypothetical protein
MGAYDPSAEVVCGECGLSFPPKPELRKATFAHLWAVHRELFSDDQWKDVTFARPEGT